MPMRERSHAREAGAIVGLVAALGCATPVRPEVPIHERGETPEPSPQTGQRTADEDAPGPGRLRRHEVFAHDATERTYHLYEAPRALGPRPLVLVLHGGSAKIDPFIGRGTGAAPLARPWLKIAEREGIHVAIPQAVDPARGPHWNDCRRDCTHCGDQDDVGFLSALVEHLQRTHEVDPDRIYVCGESNGGFMTLRLAQQRPDLFAAFGAVSALMPADTECGTPTEPASVAFVVGTKDRAARYEGGAAPLRASGSVRSAADSIGAWTRVAKCASPSSRTLPDRDRADGSTVTVVTHACPATGHEVIEYRVTGGGHVVPSVDEPVSRAWESVVGRQNHDLETAHALWEFFSAHPRGAEPR
jgi:polyhydroxybutyrate depolymerase